MDVFFMCNTRFVVFFTASLGEVTASLGEVTASLGEVTASLGEVTALLGEVTALLGGVTAPLGEVTESLSEVSGRYVPVFVISISFSKNSAKVKQEPQRLFFFAALFSLL
jgi:methyl-accepting chemotaxis protein